MKTMKKTEQSSPSSSLETMEETYLNFLIERVNRFGSMPLQNLTGHLSQLPFDVRESVGTSKSSLMSFLVRHPALFDVDSKGIVHPICNKMRQSTTRDSSCSSRSSECTSSLPQDINKGKGKIYRIFPQYGFISAIEPVKSDVYFTAHHFGDKNKTFLQEWNVHEGQLLYFNAKRGPPNCEAKYRATEVWLPEKKEQDSNDIELPYNLSSYKRKNIKLKPETGLYDSMECAGEGVIQNLFDKYGFISTKNDPRNTIFFHVRNIMNYQNIIDLKEILTKGDIVEYNAIRSTKKDSQVRWEATRVWIKSVHIASENDSGDEIFMSSPEYSPPDSDNEISSGNKFLKITASNKLKTNESMSRNSSLVCNKKENDALKGAKNVVQNMNSVVTSDSICENCFGKIYPREENKTVIKFGKSDRDIATVESDVVYVYGAKVSDIMWEVEDGQGVYFDAQKSKTSIVWKATLVWVGAKPQIVQLENNLEVVEMMDSIVDKATMKLKNTTGLEVEQSVIDNEVESINEGDSDTAWSSPCPVTSSSDASSENVTDWGDTPFPGEESLKHEIQNEFQNCEEMGETPESTDNKKNGKSNPKKLVEKTVICKRQDISNAQEPKEIMVEFPALVCPEENTTRDSGICKQINNERKSNIFEECVKEHLKTETCNEEPTDLQSTSEISKMNNVCNASAHLMPKVDIHENMCGTVKVIYNAFAEISCKKLKKPITFFWKDLYLDGVRVQEKHSNLKEVLDIGDGVNFNCFEIVDDANHSWQKVTLVWKGKKPRSVKEQKPEEFIKQHKLVVSYKMPISEADEFYNENSGQNKNIAISSAEDTNVRVQSVTLSIDSSSDSLVDNASQLESLNNSASFSTSDTAVSKITLSDVNLSKNPSVVSSIAVSDVERGDMKLSFSESQMPHLLSRSTKDVSHILNSQLHRKIQEGNFSNFQLSEDNVTTLSSVIVKSLLSQLNMCCVSETCIRPKPSAIECACQTEETKGSTSLVCVQPQQSLSDSKKECTDTVSTGMQTFITGNIISVEIFPQ